MADWSARYKVTDFTLPFTAINNSKHVTKICQKLCLDIMIEDLWRPFFCISSNLSLAEPVVHTRGLMWRAVRASMAIPGVYTPVMEGDEVLVDGGPMNNFPTDVMAQLCESDYLIGVHVSPNREKKRQYDFDTSLSGWRILFSRLNPFSKPLRSPSLFGTMQRAMEISSVHKNRTQEKLVDLLLEPDVKKFSSTDFSAYAGLVEVGYRTALEPLREWQQRRLLN
jgi:predicted acylesterase/phospholipase RssA